MTTTKLLKEAIERARELPDDQQNMAAAELIGILTDFPTAEERVGIDAGLQDYENGDYVTLDQWRHEMGLDRHQ